MTRYGWLRWSCALCPVEGEAPDRDTALRCVRVHYVTAHMAPGSRGPLGNQEPDTERVG